MGLDMEIMRVSKPDYDTDKVYSRHEIDGAVFSKQDIDEPMFIQAKPYCQELQIRNYYYNMDKIKADYGLSEDAYIGAYIAGKTIVFDKSIIDGRVEISKSLIEERYTLEKVETCFVCRTEEVKYWRKAYDIQDWFYEMIGDVENTGYYMLSVELQSEFNEAWPDDAIEVEEPSEESALFYWEWY